MKKQLYLFLFVFFALFSQLFVQKTFAEKKMSLKELGAKLRAGPEITKMYKLPSDSLVRESVLNLYELNLKNIQELAEAQKKGVRFVRGEIEEEAAMSSLLQYLQITLLRAHFHAQDKNVSQAIDLMSPWFKFSADFAYDEASLIGLQFCAVVRALLFDKLEDIQDKSGDAFAESTEFRSWLGTLSLPWPIDRALLAEAKKTISGANLKIIEKASQKLQKNPYQTSKTVIESSGPGSKELDLIKSFWKDSDIANMKNEINRLGRLKMKFAQRYYRLKTKKAALQPEDLINEKAIEHIPIDYQTGKPMLLQ